MTQSHPFFFSVILLSLMPGIAFAQPKDAFDLLALVADWVGGIIPVLLGVIMVVIFWNLAQFILHAGDEGERKKYKQFMIWGVVAVFLIVSFWGIVSAIISSFFGSTGNPALGNPGYIDSTGGLIQQ